MVKDASSSPLLYQRPSDRKVEGRKKRIGDLLRSRHLGPSELAMIEPLYGVPERRVQPGLLARWGWGIPRQVRRAYQAVSARYAKLYETFSLGELSQGLAVRKGEVDEAVSAMEQQLKRLKKSKGAGEKAQKRLLENLSRHLSGIYPSLKGIRDNMFQLSLFAEQWEQAEKQGIWTLYQLDAAHFEYLPEDTDTNVAFILQLKRNLVDLELEEVDQSLCALSEVGPSVLGVIKEVKGLHVESKRAQSRVEAALVGQTMTAYDRTQAKAYVSTLKKQGKAFSSMASRAEKAAKLLEGEMKSVKPFTQVCGSLSKELHATKKSFEKGKKQEQYFAKLSRSLDEKSAKLNQAATSASRLWLLSLFTQREEFRLMSLLVEGRIDELGKKLEEDTYFRNFTAVVSGESRFPKEGVSIMIKDYPYQARDFAGDLEKVYGGIQEANTLFLKQVSGASGKEEPEYIEKFENYLDARAKTVEKFKSDTAQGVLRDHLPELADEEAKLWVRVLEDLVVRQMVHANDLRKP